MQDQHQNEQTDGMDLQYNNQIRQQTNTPNAFSYASYTNEQSGNSEDECLLYCPCLDNNQKLSLFAIFDGKGRFQDAMYASQLLQNVLISMPEFISKDYQQALIKSLIEIDQRLKSAQGIQKLKQIHQRQMNSEDINQQEFIREKSIPGWTANVILISQDNIYCANAGDSRSVASVKGKAKSLTHNNVQTDKTEQENNAIEEIVVDSRQEVINETLRSQEHDIDTTICNRQQQIVSIIPQVTIQKRTQELQFVIMASAQIWNIHQYQKLISLVRQTMCQNADKYGQPLQNIFFKQKQFNNASNHSAEISQNGFNQRDTEQIHQYEQNKQLKKKNLSVILIKFNVPIYQNIEQVETQEMQIQQANNLFGLNNQQENRRQQNIGQGCLMNSLKQAQRQYLQQYVQNQSQGMNNYPLRSNQDGQIQQRNYQQQNYAQKDDRLCIQQSQIQQQQNFQAPLLPEHQAENQVKNQIPNTEQSYLPSPNQVQHQQLHQEVYIPQEIQENNFHVYQNQKQTELNQSSQILPDHSNIKHQSENKQNQNNLNQIQKNIEQNQTKQRIQDRNLHQEQQKQVKANKIKNEQVIDKKQKKQKKEKKQKKDKKQKTEKNKSQQIEQKQQIKQDKVGQKQMIQQVGQKYKQNKIQNLQGSSNDGKPQNNENGDKSNIKVQNRNSEELQKQNKYQIKKQLPRVEQPIITNTMIVKEAQKQRIARVQFLFNEFVKKYQKFHIGHEYVIRNLVSQFMKRKSNKVLTCFIIKQYFSQMAANFKYFHQKSYKVKQPDLHLPGVSQNLLINMQIDFKVGLDELVYVRKSMGNQFLKFNQFIQNEVLAKTESAFKQHSDRIGQAFAKVQKLREQYDRRAKQFNNQVSKVNKVYSKGKEGKKQEQDVFIQMAKFVRAERDMRLALKAWGQSLDQFRQAYMKIEQALFIGLQQTFNKFREYSKMFFAKDKHQQISQQIRSMHSQIKHSFDFSAISIITDMDYIKYVLELNEKHRHSSMEATLKNKHFLKFFTMEYFLNFTGQPADLLAGTSSKTFQLKKQDCVFVNTISGNLVQWNKNTARLQDKFAIKDITAKIVSDGVVQFNQVTKRLIFTDNRTVRIAFKDEDRAEQLIAFLQNNIQ